MLNWDNKKREFDFWLKTRLSFSLPMFKIPKINRQKWRIQSASKERSRLETLEKKYDLSKWDGVCSKSEFIGNCCFLDILDQVFKGKPPTDWKGVLNLLLISVSNQLLRLCICEWRCRIARTNKRSMYCPTFSC